jgi:general secretion pathway protein K
MKRNQTGAAVITAMLVVALAATAASFMMWQNHLWLRQVENLEAQAQARWIGRAAIDWGRAILDGDNREVDHGGDQWATRLPPLEAEGGLVTGSLSDAQGRFNLNNLVRNGQASTSDLTLLRRLLTARQLDPGLANALLDWMDADSEVSDPGGAEDQRYLALTPPYRAANRALSDVDELYRVRGFDRAVVEGLRPFVTALPTSTTINVNSAPAEVLVALCEGLQLADAKALVEYRGSAYFKGKTDFRQHLPEGVQARDEDYSVNSRYFVAMARATHGRAQFAWQALLERPAGGKTKIVWLKPFEE